MDMSLKCTYTAFVRRFYDDAILGAFPVDVLQSICGLCSAFCLSLCCVSFVVHVKFLSEPRTPRSAWPWAPFARSLGMDGSEPGSGRVG